MKCVITSITTFKTGNNSSAPFFLLETPFFYCSPFIVYCFPFLLIASPNILKQPFYTTSAARWTKIVETSKSTQTKRTFLRDISDADDSKLYD